MKKLKTLGLVLAIGFLFAGAAMAQPYSKAVGLKGTGWGYGLTGKMFLNETAAIDVGFSYKSFGAFSYNYSWTNISALYELHNEIEAVDNLMWYYGGGVSYTLYGGDFDYGGSDLNSFLGISGVLGLEYKFEDVPITLSADWVPTFGLGGYGFGADNGGGAIRYYF